VRTVRICDFSRQRDAVEPVAVSFNRVQGA